MPKILIVEDDKKLRQELENFLNKNGFAAKGLEKFDNTVQDILSENADLVLLDINLPYADGKFVCKEIRKISNVPIIMVTSRDNEIDELMSLYGGALKQLSIGCASSAGKTLIHTAGVSNEQTKLFDNLPEQDKFLEAMTDAASSVVEYFKGNIAFINVMKNISKDCDCDGNASAPCMKDIGILASLDPVAIDQACLDLVYNSEDPGKDVLIKRIESLHGVHTIEAAAELGFGTREYELINVD